MNSNKHSAGNIVNQKYEIQARMRRFLQVLTEARPNRETTRWREIQPKIIQDKRAEMRLSQQKAIEDGNERMRHNLLKILNDNRETTSNAYSPGFRAGNNGLVIDCYATNKDYDRFKNLHSRKFDLNTEQEKIIRENMGLRRQLENVQPVIHMDDFEQAYISKLRVKKVSHTALHLGLLTAAVKRQLKYRKVTQVRPMSAAPSMTNTRENTASDSGCNNSRGRAISHVGNGRGALNRSRSTSCHPLPHHQQQQTSSYSSAGRPTPTMSVSPKTNVTTSSSSESSSHSITQSFEVNNNVLLSFRPYSLTRSAPPPVRPLPSVLRIVNKMQRRLSQSLTLTSLDEKGGTNSRPHTSGAGGSSSNSSSRQMQSHHQRHHHPLNTDDLDDANYGNDEDGPNGNNHNHNDHFPSSDNSSNNNNNHNDQYLDVYSVYDDALANEYKEIIAQYKQLYSHGSKKKANATGGEIHKHVGGSSRNGRVVGANTLMADNYNGSSARSNSYDRCNDNNAYDEYVASSDDGNDGEYELSLEESQAIIDITHALQRCCLPLESDAEIDTATTVAAAEGSRHATVKSQINSKS